MSTKPPVCNAFRHASGGAWPWCDTCGWRWDFHDDPAGKRWAESRELTREPA